MGAQAPVAPTLTRALTVYDYNGGKNVKNMSNKKTADPYHVETDETHDDHVELFVGDD